MTLVARKAALVVHVVASVGWMGAVAAFFALALTGLGDPDPQLKAACYVAMGALTWPVIVPAAAAALVSGLVSALGSPWGLVRHYWVVFKLLLTALSVAVLMVHTAPIERMAVLARLGPLQAADAAAQVQLVVASGGALLVLGVVVVLSVYKPKGVIDYGKHGSVREPELRLNGPE